MSVKNFLKDNKGTIFAVAGIALEITALVFSAKDTLKAKEKVDKANAEKLEATNEELTDIEIVKTGAVCYWRTTIFAVASTACMLKSDSIHRKAEALLISAYAGIKTSYSKYKDKVDEVFGEGSDKKIVDEMNKDNLKEEMERNPFEKYPDDDNMNLYYIMPCDQIDGSSFLVECTKDEFLEVMLWMNAELAKTGLITLNELRVRFGQDKVDYGDIIGFDTYIMDGYWSSFVEYHDEISELEAGAQVHNISFTCDVNHPKECDSYICQINMDKIEY